MFSNVKKSLYIHIHLEKIYEKPSENISISEHHLKNLNKDLTYGFRKISPLILLDTLYILYNSTKYKMHQMKLFEGICE